MKYINQIFYEGLGKSLYYPLEKRVKKFKNKELGRVLIIILKILYLILAVGIAVSLFYSVV